MADETWPGQPLSADAPVDEPQDWPGQSVEAVATETPGVKGRTYGPIVGEHHHDAMFGPQGNALGTKDVALSEDLQKQYPFGSQVWANGKGPYTVADVSYVKPGHPNTNTVEFRDTATPPDRVTLSAAPPTGKKVDLETYTPQDVTPVQTLETRRAHAVNPADEPWPGTKIEAPPATVPELEAQTVEPPPEESAPVNNALVEGVSRSFKKLGSSLLPVLSGDLRPLFNMIVPNKEDFAAIAGLTKPETYQQDVKVGSPEYFEQVTDNAIPLMGVAVASGLKVRPGNMASEFGLAADDALKAQTQSPTSEAGLPYTFPKVRGAQGALPPEDFIDVPFVRVDSGTIGDRVSEFLTPTEGTRPAGGLLLKLGEDVPAPLVGYPLIPHMDGSRTVVNPSQLQGDQATDTPPPIVYDPVEAFTDQTETPTPEDLALPTMSAKEFDNYLADLQRQDQLSQAKEMGTAGTPVMDFIHDVGGLISKSQAKRTGLYDSAGGALWDDVPKQLTGVDMRHLWNGEETPDNMAMSLYNGGLIPQPTVGAMYDAWKQEHDTIRGMRAPKPIAGFESALPSPAEVQRDLESLGIHEDERLIVHGKHYIVANPLTGEIRQLFPTRDEAMQYLQNEASPGEAIVKRQPGRPDQLVAKRPDDINVQQDREIIRAQKALGKENLTGKDWDQYLNLEAPETDAQMETRLKQEGKTNEQIQAAKQKAKDVKIETKLGFKARKLRGDTGDLGQADMLEGGDLFSQPLTSGEQKTLTTLATLEAKGNILSKSGKAKLKKLRMRSKGQSGAFSLQPLEPAAKAIRESIERQRVKDVLLAKEGAVENFAVVYPKQRMDMVRRDFGMFDKNKALRQRAAKDLEALSLIEDHGLDKNALRRGRQKVATSKTSAGRLLLPKWDYALNNFDRIIRTPNRFRQEMDRQAALEAYNGIDAGYRSNYVSHLFDDDPKGFFGWFTPTSHGASGTARWFTKQRSYPTLADAVHDGKIPKSLNAADLGELRLRAGQRLVLRKNYRQLMQKLKVNGKPVAMDKPTHGYETMKLHGVDVHVNPEVSDFVAMLFEPSAVRRTMIGRGALTLAGAQKQIQLGLDTFHAARLAAYAFGAGKGATRFGYKKGLGVLELAPDDYAKAIQAGEYSPAEVKYARENRPLMMELLAQGANVAKWNDNILGDMHRLIPGTRTVNKWIFDSLSRGSITQGLLENYKRILKRFPELSREQAARKAVIEMNEQFGNLGRRTIFKHKTFQDVAQLTLLARQWVESQLRSEARAYGQMAAYPYNVVKGLLPIHDLPGHPGTKVGMGIKAFGRLGVTAQSRLSLALGLLVAGQVLNYALNGKSTFQNPDGHKLDASIPIGGKTYYIDTAQIPFEFSHQIIKYMRKGEGMLGTAAHILENKLSKLSRGAQIIATGQSYRGGAVTGPITGRGATTDNMKDRARQLAAEELPVPIAAGGAIEPEPRSNWLFRRSRRPDAGALQAASSLGAKLEPEETPRDKVYKMVRDKGMEQPGEDHGPGKYSQLKRALDNGDGRAVQEEMSLLLKEAPTRKDKLEMFKNIREVLGIRSASAIERDPTKGSINPQLFMGRVKEEILFRRKMLPEERTLYNEAQKDHQRSARFFLMLEPQLKRMNLQ